MSHSRRLVRTRSRLRAAVALVLLMVPVLVGAFVVPASAAAKASVWSQDNGSAAASRFNANETVLSPSTVGQVSRRRDLTVPGAPADAYCGYRGVDLAAASAKVDYIEGDGVLSAYEAATGKLRWSVVPDPYYTTTYRSIAVTHGLVILGEVDCVSQSDPAGYVQAFAAATGKLVWTHYIGSALYTMVLSGDYLVGTGSTVASGASTFVLRVVTGAVLWQKFGPVCGPDGLPIVVVGQQVVVHTCDQDTYATSLTAYRLTTGALTWSRAVDWPIERGDGGTAGTRHLLVRDDYGNVDDLDPATGMTRYYVFDATSVLATDATRAYARCDTAVCAFALDTGAVLWSTADDSTLAATANGVLYLGNGRMLSTATGADLGQLFTGATASILFVAGARVAAVTSARTLSLYGLAGS